MNQKINRQHILLLLMTFVVLLLGCNKSILDENYGDYVYPKSDHSVVYEFSKSTDINAQMQKLQNESNPLTLE
ncbi:MAG: hypothetical protein K8S87_08125, partial [Planctomycetes bacterium]|nr:hypothetical protein [Planctomycetota bacterium]